MTITVKAIDQITGREWFFEHNVEDAMRVNDTWFKEDHLLLGLGNQILFEGRTTWSDLEPTHYQILLLQYFNHIEQLSEIDFHHPLSQYKEPLSGFAFLAGAAIKCMKLSQIHGFQTFVITRVDEDHIIFEMISCLSLNLRDQEPLEEQPSPLRVIVDNT